MRVAWICGCLTLLSVPAGAQECFSTPEAAARSIVGTAVAGTAASTSGYSVQDVQGDAAMHRVWIRVRRCDAAGAPLILIPLQAGLAGTAAQLPQDAPYAISPAQVAPRRSFAVHAGDDVLVTFASAAVHMQVEGTANGSAALGEMVDVTLRRRGDEPAHRIRGTVRADHRVEVQP